ncbi:MAG: hypothetical protein O9293_13185 [Porphyrobacter sp.]|nr:hypothetical protein [Porphyrobacter sp.]
MLTTLLAATLALQDAPVTATPEPPAEMSVSLDALPIEQAAAARCAIAFATISRWQKAGEERGKAYPDMEAGGGREFFVRVMARLMDEAGLTRENIAALSVSEAQCNDAPEGAARLARMMPACEMMKSAAGL